MRAARHTECDGYIKHSRGWRREVLLGKEDLHQ